MRLKLQMQLEIALILKYSFIKYLYKKMEITSHDLNVMYI